MSPWLSTLPDISTVEQTPGTFSTKYSVIFIFAINTIYQDKPWRDNICIITRISGCYCSPPFSSRSGLWAPNTVFHTRPTPVSFAVCTNVHNYPVLLHLCTNCTYTWLPCVNMYIYIYLKKPMCCKYVLYLLATLCGDLLDDWGPNGPHFKNPSQGFFFITWRLEQVGTRSCSHFISDPWSTLYICKFLPMTSVASFYPSNPKSQSRRLLSICIVLLVLAYFYAF